MSNISNYLHERQKNVDIQIDRLKTTQSTLEEEISSIAEKQKNFSENKDVTYELFSPKPVNLKDSRESVQILEVNKYELLGQKKQLEDQMARLVKEKEAIQNSMSDLRRMEAFINKVVAQYHLTEP